MEENNRKIKLAQEKLVSFICHFWVRFLKFHHQAEEQLKLVEEQRKVLEERQRIEDDQRRRNQKEQEVILNKKNARPRLSFAFGGKSS